MRSRWSPLERGWMKLNTDAVVSKNDMSASIGGVIRDADATWVYDFFMAADKEAPFKFEVRAVLEGLRLA
ncbi:hypothetical protein PVK06_000153 [Gossypium arboreum]|uniref:RNase H type-1 domain-containing protein n=1 Tax=Gossypium arboreum TaxID=29729 RepID=A0ABR0QXG0_GOSAR|nr:hypothetical protein PVK06_000153 [Gossypium arboreum]